MNESFPERPTLFLDFVPPSRSKHFFLNLWVTDSHIATPWLLAAKAHDAVLQEETSLDFAAEMLNVAIMRLRSTRMTSVQAKVFASKGVVPRMRESLAVGLLFGLLGTALIWSCKPET